MKSIFKLNLKAKTNKQIFDAVMQMKSVIDTIAKEKGLDNDHDLVLASNHLDNFLNALEEQGVK